MRHCATTILIPEHLVTHAVCCEVSCHLLSHYIVCGRSADLIDYTAEEGLRSLGQGELLNSDSFPGQTRNKLCLVSKVR
jgi:hypothetical protein